MRRKLKKIKVLQKIKGFLQKKIKKLKRRLFCFYCLEIFGVHRIACKFGKFPVGIEFKNIEQNAWIGFSCAKVGICKKHLDDFIKRKGIFKDVAKTLKTSN